MSHHCTELLLSNSSQHRSTDYYQPPNQRLPGVKVKSSSESESDGDSCDSTIIYDPLKPDSDPDFKLPDETEATEEEQNDRSEPLPKPKPKHKAKGSELHYTKL